ncbi:MAG: ABC transporter ATP-binding protein [Alphaproteobacteria bacterium]
MTATPLLEVEDLRIAFSADGRPLPAVDGISFTLAPGETLGIVGESGSGKSLTALALMGLLPAGVAVSGAVRFEGRDLTRLAEAERRRIRGNRIAMIFQEPMTALNPVFTIGEQIAEVFRQHRGLKRAEARAEAVEMLRLVGIPAPERRAGDYPHQLSGGMRQRAMISIALACQPRLLIADEPTTALDVTIQAQVLDLLRELRDRLGLALILITHSLGVVAEIADRVSVMYAGRIVEEGPTADLFARPRHPYTAGLLAGIPPIDEDVVRLTPIAGTVPPLHAMPAGCRFQPRCPSAVARCRAEDPVLRSLAPRQRAACLLAAAP